MKIKTKDGKGEVVTTTDKMVIAKINGKERAYIKSDKSVFGWFSQPCKGCTRNCYNYAIGDCRDYYKWENW